MEMRRRLDVLVVDDDFADRKIVRRIIADYAFEINIVEATSVDEGIEALKEKSFDVILLDYKMPNGNGIELVKKLRAKSDLGSVAIVMMTASENEELAVACLEAGAQDLILKSELQNLNLQRAIVHAQKRFELEHKLHQNYLDVKHIAEKDPLTGLSNRHHFSQLLSMIIQEDAVARVDVALIMMDLDNFKFVNDSLGHDAGDRLLIEFSTRIKGLLRRHEGFARLGGDEFAIILTGIKTADQVAQVAQRIHLALQEPVKINENQLACNASIGAAIYPLHATNKDELVNYADIAMYSAKRAGKGQVRVYNELMQREFSRQYDIQIGLKKHLQESTFKMHFQPVVDLSTGEKMGYEALLRWPEKPYPIMPSEFIPVAEKNNAIHAIGEWVIDAAIKQLALWQEAGQTKQFVAINISPIQLQTNKASQYIIERAEYYHVQPENIVLEITETALFEQQAAIKQSIETLSEYGFKISLDDFGVGYSSISHLINYPINIVKLDKSLFKMDEGEEKRLAIFEALANMVKRLNMIVVAEGIETSEHLRLCQQLDIDYGQGFYLARPTEPEQLAHEGVLIDN